MPYKTTNKKRIRQAALALHARHGLRGLTMRAIAAEVGVSATAIYNHYPNRNAILADVWETGFVALKKSFQQPMPTEDGNERILVLTDRYIRWAVENPELFDLVYSYDVQLKRKPRSEVGEQAAYAVMAMLVEEVQRNIATGLWRQDDPWTVAVTVWALGRGVFTLYRTRRIEATDAEMPALCRHSMELLIKGLASAGAATVPGRG